MPMHLFCFLPTEFEVDDICELWSTKRVAYVSLGYVADNWRLFFYELKNFSQIVYQTLQGLLWLTILNDLQIFHPLFLGFNFCYDEHWRKMLFASYPSCRKEMPGTHCFCKNLADYLHYNRCFVKVFKNTGNSAPVLCTPSPLGGGRGGWFHQLLDFHIDSFCFAHRYLIDLVLSWSCLANVLSNLASFILFLLLLFSKLGYGSLFVAFDTCLICLGVVFSLDLARGNSSFRCGEILAYCYQVLLFVF